MKIVIVGDNFNMGGIQRVSKVIGEKIAEAHNVYFYSVYNTNNYYNIENNFIDASFPLTVEFFLRLYSKSLRTIESVIRKGEFSQARYKKAFLNKLIHFIENNNIDIVILTSPVLITSIFYLKRNTKAKYIAWLHNNYDTYINKYTKGYNQEFYKGLKSADKVVCLTKYDYTKYSLLNDKTTYIYNPLTIDNKRTSELTNKKICFTGRIEFEHKGIDRLLKVAKYLPSDWKIELAGTGKKDQVAKLKKIIKDERLEQKIIFKGPLKEELINHYLESSIYLMTSRWEGMPLVLAEAMSFGLPIVAFEQTGSSEVLDGGNFGVLIENGNIEEMVKQLKKLVNSFDLRKEYQKLSLQRVQDFDMKKIIGKWLSLIKDCEENI
ncbi:glycosyltransferase family 4 protein [Tetragenococcus halophilus]|uniref:Glycosyltransferase family 4 protein n=1 Tax=Tetragenococcus halophilus TaxID=51669 RepID=A0A3G5FH34_TETHA|nr:glycosyltransferase [Tetragenococcus halophilus]AYW49640.1 glycosyltransferase family 4 protein [Tetragenococcus halophilus]GBD64732.1 hypothetical protein TEHD23766T_2159 [Tetragenococcus halophilus subsp. flandriensis]